MVWFRVSENQVIACAGVVQAASLVQDLARSGSAQEDEMLTAIGSVLRLDPTDTVTVFGDVKKISRGLKAIATAPSGRHKELELEQSRYAWQLMRLQASLAKSPDTQIAIGRALRRIDDNYGDRPEGVATCIMELAELYERTLSTLKPRIIVQGKEEFLTDPTIPTRIRTALLAGVRAAQLWRQVGGREWQFFLGRQQYRAIAGTVLSKIDPS